MANKLFFESFDHPYWSYDKLWTSYGSPFLFDVGQPRNGVGGLRLPESLSNPASANCYNQWLGKNLGEFVPRVVLGFAYRMPARSAGAYYYGNGRRWNNLCQFQSEDYNGKSSLQLITLPTSSACTSFALKGVAWSNTGDPNGLYDGSGNIVPSQSSVLLALDTWYYIEVDVKFSTTGDGWFKVYVDGEQAFSATNIKTVNADVAGTAFGGFLLGGVGPGGNGSDSAIWSSWTLGSYDDLYCHYGNSPTRLGDLTVENKVIGAEALFTSWSAYPSGTAATNVTDNDAATGISSSVVDDQHLFTFGDISATPETIHGLQVCAIGQKTDSGARNLALVAHERWYSGVLTASAIVADDTVSIGYSGSEVVYTFKASPTVAYEVAVGGDLEESLANLATAINEGDTNGGVAHSLGTATSNATTLTFLANAGLNGALILTTETAGSAAWDDAQLTQYNDADASADLPMSANTKSFIHTFAVDPRTSTGWTKNRLNNAFIGVKCR